MNYTRSVFGFCEFRWRFASLRLDIENAARLAPFGEGLGVLHLDLAHL